MNEINLFVKLTPAIFIACAMSTANAGVSIAGTGVSNGLSITDATTLQVNRGGGPGHISLVPYYSTQNGNSTLLNITNTDEINGKAVKVRFRSAVNADSVFDFTVLLAPADVWSANISQGVDGKSVLTTTDESCTLPANVNSAFSIDRLPTVDLTTAQRAEWTREGYIEILTMADIPPVLVGGGINNLFSTIAHTDGNTICASTSSGTVTLNSLSTDPQNEAAARNLGFDTPTSGLLVSSILINVFGASVSWTTPTTSITGVNGSGLPSHGRLVFSPQTSATAINSDTLTNDPLLRSTSGGGTPKITPRQFDFPDLSTPYITQSANSINLPSQYLEIVSDALTVKILRNEFLLSPEIFAHTDWTISQPTRRFALGFDYSSTPYVAIYNPNAFESSKYNWGTMDGRGCFSVSGDNPIFFDRKSKLFGSYGGYETLFPAVSLCGAVAVLVFSDENLKESVLHANISSTSIFTLNPITGGQIPAELREGWARLYVEGNGMNGLPVMGASYIHATGPLVAGKSTNFGVLYNHNTTPH